MNARSDELMLSLKNRSQTSGEFVSGIGNIFYTEGWKSKDMIGLLVRASNKLSLDENYYLQPAQFAQALRGILGKYNKEQRLAFLQELCKIPSQDDPGGISVSDFYKILDEALKAKALYLTDIVRAFASGDLTLDALHFLNGQPLNNGTLLGINDFVKALSVVLESLDDPAQKQAFIENFCRQASTVMSQWQNPISEEQLNTERFFTDVLAGALNGNVLHPEEIVKAFVSGALAPITLAPVLNALPPEHELVRQIETCLETYRDINNLEMLSRLLKDGHSLKRIVQIRLEQLREEVRQKVESTDAFLEAVSGVSPPLAPVPPPPAFVGVTSKTSASIAITSTSLKNIMGAGDDAIIPNILRGSAYQDWRQLDGNHQSATQFEDYARQRAHTLSRNGWLKRIFFGLFSWPPFGSHAPGAEDLRLAAEINEIIPKEESARTNPSDIGSVKAPVTPDQLDSSLLPRPKIMQQPQSSYSKVRKVDQLVDEVDQSVVPEELRDNHQVNNQEAKNEPQRQQWFEITEGRTSDRPAPVGLQRV